MRRLHLFFWGSLVIITVLWMLADSFTPDPLTYFSFRFVFVQYTGIIATAVMSLSLLLAVRPGWLEPHLDGLDKIYRLHKWLGISALFFSLLHWWWSSGTKWLVGLGLLERPQRTRGAQETLSWFLTFINSQRGFSEAVGEWAFYLMLILIVLALVKLFPYHWFKKTHKWLALIYLPIVYHSVILTKVDYWAQPIGWLSALLMIVGTWSAILILLGRVGKRKIVSGEIISVNQYVNLGILETRILVDSGWPGHSAGQFAFVTFDKREGAHPFTIASAWNPVDKAIMIISKELGDYTNRLRNEVKIGDRVALEGPYGCFDFSDEQPRQVWVGAGIGITPFIARLKQLAIAGDKRPIDLFHSSKEYEVTALERLKSLAEAAGVKLHIMIDDRDGFLNAEIIRSKVPDWKTSSFWFCGPPKFGQKLRADFVGQGMSSKHFHQELFHFR